MERDAGFWRKLFGLRTTPAARPGHSMEGRVVTGVKPDWSRYDDCMKVSVAGESHYQEALIAVSECPEEGEHGYECSAELVLEPDNPHDKYAVRVEIKGQHVGYLPRGTAKRLGKRLRGLKEEGRQAICMAYIGRGTDHPNLGVNLRLPYNGEILQGKR
jgi:HIRAN domain